MKFQIDAKPVTFKARPYPKKQSEYLRSYLAKIEQLGLVLRNDQSHLSLPALPVRKGLYTNECLKTVDYTRVIRVLIPLAGVTPDIKATTTRVSGAILCLL